MITYKSKREIEQMKASGALLASIHEALRDFIKPGVSTHDIDQFVQKRIEAAGGVAAQIGYQGYRFATCTSVNDEICHGFPRKQPLKQGDLVKVDFCINLNGGISDSCWSYRIGEVDPLIDKLYQVTKTALYKGIEQVKVGNRIGDIGHAIQTYVEAEGFSVVRDFVGHGIGPSIHEDPMIPHYGQAGTGQRLKPGMCITVEPMVNIGSWQAKMDNNGWTARTLDGKYSCQFEHSIAITEDGPIIMTEQIPET